MKAAQFRIHPLFLLLIILLSCGCSGPESFPRGTVHLTIWGSLDRFEVQWLKDVVGKWNSSHPGVQVRFRPALERGSPEDVLNAAVASGATPDICVNISPSTVSRFSKLGALVPVDQVEGFMGFLRSRTPKQIIQIYTSPDGHLYQVPWKCSPMAMFYNKGVFEEIKMPPPRTYSEWFKAAEMLKKTRKGIFITSFDTSTSGKMRTFDFYPLYLAASRGRSLFNSKGRPDFNNPQALKVMEFLRENFERGYAPAESLPGDPFAEGEIAVKFATSADLVTLSETAADLEYDIAPLPVPDDYDRKQRIRTFAESSSIIVFSNTLYPRECVDFIKFLTSPENEAAFVRLCTQPIYRAGAKNEPAFEEILEEMPLLAKFFDCMPDTRPLDDDSGTMEVLNAFSEQYIPLVLERKKDPKKTALNLAQEALKRAQKKAESVIYNQD